MPSQEPIPAFDLYAELEIDQSASRQAIESAYRSKAKRGHPDVAPDPAAATARMKRLNVARAWLADPDARRRYDRATLEGRRPLARATVVRTTVDRSAIDPLGSWPADPLSSPPDPGARFGGIPPAPIALSALMVVIASVAVGIGSSPLTVAGFAAGVVVMTFYGLLAILGAILPPRP